MKFDAYSANGQYAHDVVHEPSVAPAPTPSRPAAAYQGALRVRGYEDGVHCDGALAKTVTVHPW